MEDKWSGDSKFVAPLSPRTDVVVYFDGVEPPDAACFMRLRQFIDILERSLLGEPARGKKLKPCKKHPNAPRDPVTNRCKTCLTLLAAHMNEKRRQKRAKGIMS